MQPRKTYMPNTLLSLLSPQVFSKQHNKDWLNRSNFFSQDGKTQVCMRTPQFEQVLRSSYMNLSGHQTFSEQ